MGEEKVHMNMVVIGRVGSGKSTTTGRLISELGGTDEGAMERFEEEAAAMNMERVSDLVRAERERGITALWKFETDKYDCTLIDPRDRGDGGLNVFNGACMADCAVLVVDSTAGGFERGVSWWGGRAGLHPLIAYSLGVDQMICCCNKMDATTPKYSKGRYEEIVKRVSHELKMDGYDPDKIPFVPISASEGDNIVERSTNLDWYKGPTLLEALDNLDQPERRSEMPTFRIAVELPDVRSLIKL